MWKPWVKRQKYIFQSNLNNNQRTRTNLNSCSTQTQQSLCLAMDGAKDAVAEIIHQKNILAKIGILDQKNDDNVGLHGMSDIERIMYENSLKDSSADNFKDFLAFYEIYSSCGGRKPLLNFITAGTTISLEYQLKAAGIIARKSKLMSSRFMENFELIRILKIFFDAVEAKFNKRLQMRQKNKIKRSMRAKTRVRPVKSVAQPWTCEPCQFYNKWNFCCKCGIHAPMVRSAGDTTIQQPPLHWQSDPTRLINSNIDQYCHKQMEWGQHATLSSNGSYQSNCQRSACSAVVRDNCMTHCNEITTQPPPVTWQTAPIGFDNINRYYYPMTAPDLHAAHISKQQQANSGVIVDSGSTEIFLNNAQLFDPQSLIYYDVNGKRAGMPSNRGTTSVVCADGSVHPIAGYGTFD